MLKFKLDSLEGVDEAIAAMYTEKDGAYFLSVDGLPANEDVSGLKAKNAELLAEKKAAEDKRRLAEDEAERTRLEKAQKENDFESIAKSLQDKLDQTTNELSAIKEKDAVLAKKLVADELASSLCPGTPANARLLSRFIGDRLRYDDGAVKITDNDGNLTVSTIEDLAAEFRKNEDYSGLIVATNGTGGGADGGSGGAASKNFSEMDTAEKTALYRKDPAQYDRLKAAS